MYRRSLSSTLHQFENVWRIRTGKRLFAIISFAYLSEYFSDHLADVLSPLGDVWVEVIQVPAEAQRDDLEVIWDMTEHGRSQHSSH